MKRKKIISKRTSGVRRERDPIPWKYCFLTLVCGLLLVTGFFWAARLHFSSIDYGIKNAKLRQKVENLKSEKRRMILRREIALSGIDKAAHKIGFRRRTVQNIEIVSLQKPIKTKQSSDTSGEMEKTVKTFANSKPVVKQKTVKLRDIEKKIAKTVISKPKLPESGSEDRRKPSKKGRRIDSDAQGLVAKKR